MTTIDMREIKIKAAYDDETGLIDLYRPDYTQLKTDLEIEAAEQLGDMFRRDEKEVESLKADGPKVYSLRCYFAVLHEGVDG